MSNTTWIQDTTLTTFHHLLNLRAKTQTCRECHVVVTTTAPALKLDAVDWRIIFRQGKTTT